MSQRPNRHDYIPPRSQKKFHAHGGIPISLLGEMKVKQQHEKSSELSNALRRRITSSSSTKKLHKSLAKQVYQTGIKTSETQLDKYLNSTTNNKTLGRSASVPVIKPQERGLGGTPSIFRDRDIHSETRNSIFTREGGTESIKQEHAGQEFADIERVVQHAYTQVRRDAGKSIIEVEDVPAGFNNRSMFPKLDKELRERQRQSEGLNPRAFVQQHASKDTLTLWKNDPKNTILKASPTRVN